MLTSHSSSKGSAVAAVARERVERGARLVVRAQLGEHVRLHAGDDRIGRELGDRSADEVLDLAQATLLAT